MDSSFITGIFGTMVHVCQKSDGERVNYMTGNGAFYKKSTNNVRLICVKEYKTIVISFT